VNAHIGPKRENRRHCARVQQVAVLQVLHLALLVHQHLERLATAVLAQSLDIPPALINSDRAVIRVESVVDVLIAARLRLVVQTDHHVRPRSFGNSADAHHLVAGLANRSI